jgi:hypothetical protein
LFPYTVFQFLLLPTSLSFNYYLLLNGRRCFANGGCSRLWNWIATTRRFISINKILQLFSKITNWFKFILRFKSIPIEGFNPIWDHRIIEVSLKFSLGDYLFDPIDFRRFWILRIIIIKIRLIRINVISI